MKSPFETVMPASKRAPLPRTTVPFAEQRPVATSGYARFSAPLLTMWTVAMPGRHIAYFRKLVMDGLNLSMEAYGANTFEGLALDDLTVTSLAVVRDSAADSLLLLPLALYLGGDIRQVDSQGRTLLHFATTRRVARYLVEHGVPVAKGKRKALLKALEKPMGLASFDDEVPLGMVDNAGNEPPFLDCVRTSTAAQHMDPEAVAIPQSHWQSVLSSELYNGLLGIGFNESDDVRVARDPLAQTGRAALRADFSPFFELWQALLEGRAGSVRALLELGTDPDLPLFGHDLGNGSDVRGLTATAIAVLVDCEATEKATGLRKRPGKKSAELAEGRPVLPLFEGHTDFSGIHGEGGKTLMHFARTLSVATWLMDHGAPCDVKDDDGNLPGDVLPPKVAAIVNRHLLERRLVAGKKGATTRSRL
jgi:hypothetical protein